MSSSQRMAGVFLEGGLEKIDKHGRGPALGIIDLTGGKIDGAESVWPVARVDVQAATDIAGHGLIAEAFHGDKQAGTAEFLAQATISLL